MPKKRALEAGLTTEAVLTMLARVAKHKIASKIVTRKKIDEHRKEI